MEFDFSPQAVVNAGGALIFVIEGVLILAVARGRPRGLLVGACTATVGLTLVLDNLIVSGSWDVALLKAAAFFAAAACTTLLAIHLAGADARRPLFVAGATLAGALFLLGAFLGIRHRALIEAYEFDVNVAGMMVFAALGAIFYALPLLLLAGALHLRGLPVAAGTQRRAVWGLMMTFGPFIMLLESVQFMIAARGVAVSPAFVFVVLAGGALFAVLVALAYLVPRSPEPHLARILFASLFAAALLGSLLTLLTSPQYRDFGAYGIVRTVGAVFLAVAVLKHDLLGVPLPRIAVKRGVVATAALATFFVVAQIVQNFLSSFFSSGRGFLFSGVLAGIVLFAANPIQKTIERMTERGAVAAKNEGIYRNAVRLALRDRKLNRREEVHLHELAAALGLPAGRAHEILAEIEEKAA